MNTNLLFLLNIEKRKRPGQRRMAWSTPTEIKENLKVEAP